MEEHNFGPATAMSISYDGGSPWSSDERPYQIRAPVGLCMRLGNDTHQKYLEKLCVPLLMVIHVKDLEMEANTSRTRCT